MKPTFTVGVFAIVHDDDRRVLLCHRRDHDLWNLPGGVLEHGEAPWDGVIREVREETGLEVEVSRLAGVYSKPDANDLVFSFLCRRTGGDIALSDEADRIEFFRADELPPNTIPKQVERIADSIFDTGTVVCRVQRGTSSIQLSKGGTL